MKENLRRLLILSPAILGVVVWLITKEVGIGLAAGIVAYGLIGVVALSEYADKVGDEIW